MSIDIETAKQDLLNLKEEYETRIDKIEDHIKTRKTTSMNIGKIRPSHTVKTTCAQA
jgi:hypothetical protein